MISKIANKLTSVLFEANVINYQDQDLYNYGFYILVSKFFFLLVSIVVGLILSTLPESITFYFMFSVIRESAGGFHATSENKCLIFSLIALILTSVSIRLLIQLNAFSVPLLFLIIGTLIILKLCPLDSPSKPLDAAEIKEYRLKSVATLILFNALALLAILLERFSFFYTVTLCITLESVLLILGKSMSTQAA